MTKLLRQQTNPQSSTSILTSQAEINSDTVTDNMISQHESIGQAKNLNMIQIELLLLLQEIALMQLLAL